MDIKEVYDIWDRFEKSDIDEVEIELGEDRVYFKKKADIDETAFRLQTGIPVNTVSQVSVENNSQNTANENANLPYEGSPVKAPIVGTFYRASAPGATPFVKEGSKVKKGDVIGIIEAMKLMNELVSPKDGKIEKILIDDGEMVEYDQVIMSIK